MVSRPLMSNPTNINISIDKILIREVQETKFLGVFLDNKLLWKSHINNSKSNLSKITGVVHKIRNSLNEESLRLVYFSLVYPHLLYCCAIWGGACKNLINSVFVSQKTFLRIMW